MPDTRPVWDLPTRLFHWLLALSFGASWLTGEIGYDARPVHMWLGYWMLGLLSFRIAWGIVGPRHARFASFFPTPRRLAAYLRALRRGEAVETPGHSPLGALSVFAMLGLLVAQAVSGLFVDDDILYAGPYRARVGAALADVMETVHHVAFDWLLVLVGLHLLAVAYYTFVRKHALLRAMITGRKPASVVPPEAALTGARTPLAIVLALAAAAWVYWLVAVLPTR